MKVCYSNHVKITIFIILKFFMIIDSTAANEDGTPTPETCSFDETKNAIWKQCACMRMPGTSAANIYCNRVPWTTVPQFQEQNISSSSDSYNIVSLSIVDSSLLHVPQDAFAVQKPYSIDLTRNHITSINVNAFRAAEDHLTQLNLNHNQLHSVPTLALTRLSQLQYLSLQNNIISEINPSTFDDTRLDKLRYLHLDYNQIAYLPKGSLNSLPLHVLTASNNKIGAIEKLALPITLSYLDFKNNLLQQVPYLALAYCKVLQTLDLEGNNITKITASADAEFKTPINLLLKSNRIESIGSNAFQSFRKLKKLDLSYNQISRISGNIFSSIVELKHLDLSCNSIAHIPDKTFENIGKSMQTLNLEENHFHILPAAIRDLRSLETLNLNNNKLNMLDSDVWNNLKPALVELLLAYNRLTDVPTNVLDGMKKLQVLDLSKNKIKKISRLSFGTFDGTGTALKRLNLAGNLLEEISDPGAFLYMSSLTHLDLSYNQLTRLGNNAFLRLENLDTLNLEGNKIDRFPTKALYGLTKLRYLLLDNNPISSLPDLALLNIKMLEQFSMSKTTLSMVNKDTFHSTSAENLKLLNLAFNSVYKINRQAFHDLNQLEQLFLHNNRLRVLHSMTFSTMKNLRHLSLANNRLEQIEERALKDLYLLEQLSLANNRIRNIPRGSFVNLNNLRYLDFSGNLLRYFDLSFLQQPTVLIERLDLSHNKIEIIDLAEAERTLTHLNLANNRFQAITKNMVNGFNVLHFLDLSDNGIFEIQNGAFASSRNLRTLKLGNNHLRHLKKNTFVGQEQLEILELRNNEIAKIEEGAFGENNVRELDLSNNNLEKIPSNALVSIGISLFTLNLEGNKIKLLDAKSFGNMENLTMLTLSHNRIEAIEEGAFSSLQNLIKLDLSHNPVVSWNPQAFKRLGQPLEILNLAETGLFSLPEIKGGGLRHLNISRNKIQELQTKDMSNYKKLEVFDVSFNDINELDRNLFGTLHELKTLNICGNPIRKIASEHFKSLNRVETLSICQLPSLYLLPHPQDFSYLRSLKHLQMYEFPFLMDYKPSEILRNLPPLQTLEIEINEPTLNEQFSYADLRLLRNLIVKGKALTRISPTAFMRLRGFKFSLTITNTSIEEFPTAIFNTLANVNLLSLSLAHNRIKHFEPFKHTQIPTLNQYGTTLENLNLQERSINCDCRLQWINEWVVYSQTIPSRFSDLKCTFLMEDDASAISHYDRLRDNRCSNESHRKYSIVHTLVFIMFSEIAYSIV